MLMQQVFQTIANFDFELFKKHGYRQLNFIT